MSVFAKVCRPLAALCITVQFACGLRAEVSGEAEAQAAVPVSDMVASIPWIIGTVVTLVVLMVAAWQFMKRRGSHWSVPRRIATGFGAILLVLASLALGGYLGMRWARAGFVDYRSSARNAMLAGRIQANFLKMRLAAEIFQFTGKAEQTQIYTERLQKTLGFIEEGQKSFSETEDREELATIARSVARHQELFQQLRAAPAGAVVADLGKQMMEVGAAADAQIEALKLDFVEQQNRTGPAVNRDLEETEIAMGCTAAGGVIFGSFLAWLIGRSVVLALTGLAGDLASGATQTAAASAQMSSASQTLAGGTSEQAASLEETSASLEELTSMVRRNAQAAAKAKQIAGDTRVSAETGSADMAEMQAAMNAIKTSSGEVAKIAQAIDAIAFQTNILALNAAVEAARAGDAGMGFAVVADEVRTLAQRSATSARETTARIEDALTKTERGVVLSAKVAQSLAAISQRTREVDQYVAEIAGASSEQSQGVSQINLAVTQLDQATQNNAAIAEESAAAAEELASQAEALKGVAQTLQQLAGAATAEQASRKAQRQAAPERPSESSTTCIRNKGVGRASTAPKSRMVSLNV